MYRYEIRDNPNHNGKVVIDTHTGECLTPTQLERIGLKDPNDDVVAVKTPEPVEPVACIDELCQCGHSHRAHLYHAGRCLPGFACKANCKEFVSASLVVPSSESETTVQPDYLNKYLTVLEKKIVELQSSITELRNELKEIKETQAKLKAKLDAAMLPTSIAGDIVKDAMRPLQVKDLKFRSNVWR